MSWSIEKGKENCHLSMFKDTHLQNNLNSPTGRSIRISVLRGYSSVKFRKEVKYPYCRYVKG